MLYNLDPLLNIINFLLSDLLLYADIRTKKNISSWY